MVSIVATIRVSTLGLQKDAENVCGLFSPVELGDLAAQVIDVVASAKFLASRAFDNFGRAERAAMPMHVLFKPGTERLIVAGIQATFDMWHCGCGSKQLRRHDVADRIRRK